MPATQHDSALSDRAQKQTASAIEQPAQAPGSYSPSGQRKTGQAGPRKKQGSKSKWQDLVKKGSKDCAAICSLHGGGGRRVRVGGVANG